MHFKVGMSVVKRFSSRPARHANSDRALAISNVGTNAEVVHMEDSERYIVLIAQCVVME